METDSQESFSKQKSEILKKPQQNQIEKPRNYWKHWIQPTKQKTNYTKTYISTQRFKKYDP